MMKALRYNMGPLKGIFKYELDRGSITSSHLVGMGFEVLTMVGEGK